MTVIEISGSQQPELTFRQRWSHYLVLIFSAVGLLIGFNLRESILGASIIYANPQAGITAEYPQNWLLDEADNSYIFRVRDIASTSFKTTIQVAARPVGPLTTPRIIFDSLTFERGQTLGYNVISEEAYTLPDGTQTRAMIYSFVSSQTDPFLQAIDVVTQGIDILFIEREQAVIVTFLSDANTFNDNLPVLEQFLRSLTF
jgi:hypothetical protein